MQSTERTVLTDSCNSEDVAGEAIWLQSTLTETLNQHAKCLRVSAHSKRWWSTDIKSQRQYYAQIKRAWEAGSTTDAELRKVRNGFYRTIRRAKRECWEVFLTGNQKLQSGRLGPED